MIMAFCARTKQPQFECWSLGWLNSGANSSATQVGLFCCFKTKGRTHMEILWRFHPFVIERQFTNWKLSQVISLPSSQQNDVAMMSLRHTKLCFLDIILWCWHTSSLTVHNRLFRHIGGWRPVNVYMASQKFYHKIGHSRCLVNIISTSIANFRNNPSVMTSWRRQ